MTRLPDTPDDPVTDAQCLFLMAVERAAPKLVANVCDVRQEYVNERDHLQPTFKASLEEVASEAVPRPEVSGVLDHGLGETWPRLGKFDVSLSWAGSTSVFGELKCGDSEKALSACAWDAAKCAFCLRHGVGVGMLLVAAAPWSLWERDTLGTELFLDGEWNMADVRERYAKGFAAWEREGYMPLRVPEALATFDIGRTEFTIAGNPWVLGVARVEPVGHAWLDWEPFLPTTG
jgi:hypothetical protein